jgi:hypothetical protein
MEAGYDAILEPSATTGASLVLQALRRDQEAMCLITSGTVVSNWPTSVALQQAEGGAVAAVTANTAAGAVTRAVPVGGSSARSS